MERAVAEALVSLVMHSYVLDPELLLAFANNPRVVASGRRRLRPARRIHHPRASGRQRSPAPSPAFAVCDFARATFEHRSREVSPRHKPQKKFSLPFANWQRSVTTDGTPALTRTAAAVEWLIEQFKPTARLVLPGSLAAYQEDVHQAVSLPLEDLVRILTGKPAAPRMTRKTDPSNAALSPFTRAVESISIPSEPLPAITGVHTAPASRARAMSLHREIRRQITQIVRKRDKRSAGDEINYSRYARQKKKLKSFVERVIGEVMIIPRWPSCSPAGSYTCARREPAKSPTCAPRVAQNTTRPSPVRSCAPART